MSKLDHPSKEYMTALPPFVGLAAHQIHWVGSPGAATTALQELLSAPVVGFDTESKPTFVVGAPRTGPHLVQLATRDDGFCVPCEAPWAKDFLAAILQVPEPLKVGFGVASDRAPLFGKFGIKLKGALDLAPVVRKLGYRQKVGLQAAVAIVLGQRLSKSKSVQTSNWAARPLSTRQVAYAADDAYASLKVFDGLKALRPEFF